MPRNDDGRLRRAAPSAPPTAAVGLVECVVRVSPALARRIRKTAELEAGGASIADALLAAAGVPAGRIQALEAEVKEQAGILAEREREVAERGRAVERGRATLKEREAELTQLRRAQATLQQDFAAAQRERAAAEKRGDAAEAAAVKLRAALAASLPLAGLDEGGITTLRDMAERLRAGGDRNEAVLAVAGYAPDEIDDALAERKRPELRAASEVLATGGWRAWLLRRLIG